MTSWRWCYGTQTCWGINTVTIYVFMCILVVNKWYDNLSIVPPLLTVSLGYRSSTEYPLCERQNLSKDMYRQYRNESSQIFFLPVKFETAVPTVIEIPVSCFLMTDSSLPTLPSVGCIRNHKDDVQFWDRITSEFQVLGFLVCIRIWVCTHLSIFSSDVTIKTLRHRCVKHSVRHFLLYAHLAILTAVTQYGATPCI